MTVEHLERRLTLLKRSAAHTASVILKVEAQLVKAKIFKNRPASYKVGQRFRLVLQDGAPIQEIFLLAQVGNEEFNLIGLTMANRWTSPLSRSGIVSTKIPSIIFHDHFTTIRDSYWELIK